MYKTCEAAILFPYTSVQIVTSGFFEWWGAAAQTTSVDHDDDDDGDGDEVSNPPWIYSVQHLGLQVFDFWQGTEIPDKVEEKDQICGWHWRQAVAGGLCGIDFMQNFLPIIIYNLYAV